MYVAHFSASVALAAADCWYVSKLSTASFTVADNAVISVFRLLTSVIISAASAASDAALAALVAASAAEFAAAPAEVFASDA